MKIFVTKYALSGGIRETEAERSPSSDGMWEIGRPSVSGYFRAEEYALTRAAAIRQAEDRRQKKIASLRKQITKLEKLRFE